LRIEDKRTLELFKGIAIKSKISKNNSKISEINYLEATSVMRCGLNTGVGSERGGGGMA